jgi:hypothetical protein
MERDDLDAARECVRLASQSACQRYVDGCDDLTVCSSGYWWEIGPRHSYLESALLGLTIQYFESGVIKGLAGPVHAGTRHVQSFPGHAAGR